MFVCLLDELLKLCVSQPAVLIDSANKAMPINEAGCQAVKNTLPVMFVNLSLEEAGAATRLVHRCTFHRFQWVHDTQTAIYHRAAAAAATTALPNVF